MLIILLFGYESRLLNDQTVAHETATPSEDHSSALINKQTEAHETDQALSSSLVQSFQALPAQPAQPIHLHAPHSCLFIPFATSSRASDHGDWHKINADLRTHTDFKPSDEPVLPCLGSLLSISLHYDRHFSSTRGETPLR